MRFLSVCSGVEAASVACKHLNWEAVGFSEIEDFPNKVLAYHYPNVKNYGDIRNIRGEDFNGRTDMLVGGTPCFVKGSMVLTPKGYLAIENIREGDDVVTFDGNIKKVIAFGSKKARVGELKIVGRNVIRCTPNHPFHCVECKRNSSEKSPNFGRNEIIGSFVKTRAAKSVGKMIARPVFKNHPRPNIPQCYSLSEKDVVELGGWYVGDGYIRRHKRKNKKAVIFALVNSVKIEKFLNKFGTKLNYTLSKDGKITIYSTALAEWFILNFGEMSHSKRIPYWLYCDDYKSSFLEGYRNTDGYDNGKCVSYTTTSSSLAYGVADLYRTANVSYHVRPQKHIIQGRVVNQKNFFVVKQSHNTSNKIKEHEGRLISKVRSFNVEEKGELVDVFNITVEDEHTYIVNGIATYNCQNFSVSGNRQGLDGESSVLAWEYVRLLREIRPRWFVWENVPGALSTNGGRDYASLLKEMEKLGYGVAGRILDAKNFGVPQNRRRIFLVGYLGDWRPPFGVLFERESLSGNIGKMREKEQTVTTNTGKDTDRESERGIGHLVVYESHSMDARYREVDNCPILKRNGCKWV